MKINEFIEKVNEHDGLEIDISDHGAIEIYTNDDDFLMSIPRNAENILDIKFWITDLNNYIFNDDKKFLASIISKFLTTPVNERFSEKKYRLRWINSSEDPTKTFITPNTYLGREKNSLDGFCWATQAIEIAEIFTESELEHLKKENPRLAPAIDVMKEPVED